MTEMPEPEASWGEYRRLILAELERISRDIEALSNKFDTFHRDEISQLKVDIAMLQVKSGLWGAASAAIVMLGAILLGIAK